jgi:hypothetical protein
MFRFTIRDVLWLTVVVAFAVGWTTSARRMASLEARQQSAERRMERLKAENESVSNESRTIHALNEAVVTAFKDAELSDEQRDSIRQLIQGELNRQGVEIPTVQ